MTANNNISKMIPSSASIALLLLSSTLTTPQVQAQETAALCSCSPTRFTFALNLANNLAEGSCEVDDIKSNPGIEFSLCTVEGSVTLPMPSSPDDDDATAIATDDEGTLPPTPEASGSPITPFPTHAPTTSTLPTTAPRPRTSAPIVSAEAPVGDITTRPPVGDITTRPPVLPAAATRPPVAVAESVATRPPVAAVEESDEELVRRQRRGRRLDEEEPNANPIVVEIVSVQFLEFDTKGDLTVINQDDTYTNVSLKDGDVLQFDSASSYLDTSLPLEDQLSNPAVVPGGASLILYGKTADGELVRNRFFWTYDMNCGRDNSPVEVGDEIGWVTVSETSNAWPAFCPALPTGTPTIGPRSNIPTLTPSKSPTDRPTVSYEPTYGPTDGSTPGVGHALTGFPTEPVPTSAAPITAAPTEKNSLLFRAPTEKPTMVVTHAPTKNVVTTGDGEQTTFFGKSLKADKPTMGAKSAKALSYDVTVKSKAGKHEKYSKSSKGQDSKSGKGTKSFKSGDDHLYAGQLDRTFDARASISGAGVERYSYGLSGLLVVVVGGVVASWM